MSNTNGENNGQMGTPPNGNNNSDGNNQGTPPSKTEDSSENALSNTQQSQMMEKTDGKNGQENGNMPSAPNMQNGENMPSMSGQSNQIEIAYYIIFGNVTVDKTGDSDGGDSSNFYGNNSAILAKDGANLTITNTTITTEADGANGVFSYGGSATTNNSSSDGTTVTINLTNNTIINNDSTGNFLRAQKDSWGNSGSNGGNVTLVMTKQNAIGNIAIDSISTLDMTMNDNSYYEGTINGSNEAKSITLKLDSTSKIKLTGDSYITTLDDADTSYENIDFNGYTLYVNGVAIN